jgi:alanine racemase
MPRPTVALIDPRRLRHNLSRVRELAPNSRVLSCIKSDAYGHGAATAARALAPGSDGFAVATLEEAMALRNEGVELPILLLEGVHAPGDWAIAAGQALTVAVTDMTQLQLLREQAPGRSLSCWLKIDTGMHRLGIAPDAIETALAQLRGSATLSSPITLFTHFAGADAQLPGDARAQLARFLDVAERCALPRSTANSAAILAMPEAHLEVVRPGYMLYGGSPFSWRSAASCGLLPAMQFRSGIIALRDIDTGERVGYGGRWQAQRPSRIATIAAGYGDGYPRHAEDGTPVAILGHRAPLAGRVSMDMITVDVTGIPGVEVGCEVELWGDQIPVDEVASHAGTIGYELLAGMPARVPRVCIE